jgi:hypothetical protein
MATKKATAWQGKKPPSKEQSAFINVVRKMSEGAAKKLMRKQK